MPSLPALDKRVVTCLQRFLASTGRENITLTERTNLVRDVGMTSDEGIDFVLDLCDEFNVELPNNFNPVIHDTGRRGRRVGELINTVATLIHNKEVGK